MIRKTAWVIAVLWIATAIGASAQTFTKLLDFSLPLGFNPESVPVQGRDGNLYGTTHGGGSDQFGTVFQVTRSGQLQTLHSFHFDDGAGPSLETLLLHSDGSFYGETLGGGRNSRGTIFRITPSGQLTTLYDFCRLPQCADGSLPYAGLSLTDDGSLIGTTNLGGDPCSILLGCGTVFRLQGNALSTLHIFHGADGIGPASELVEDKEGSYYGTTTIGGDPTCNAPYGCGTVFKIAPDGTFSLVHIFVGEDGSGPGGSLVLSPDGALFGTTGVGGNVNCNFPWGCGTVFRLSRAGALTVLHIFEVTDGYAPRGGLVRGSDGTFYGTTDFGGDMSCHPVGCGTIFSITSSGAFSTLHRFVGSDGNTPFTSLAQATDGIFYGTTEAGGLSDLGTLFALDLGLRPFVAFVRDSCKVGGSGGILGQGFTGTSSVSLNGTPANFKVVSDTFLKATVPDGATTGLVTVTTPSGTLTSNKPFRVTPQLLSFDPPSGRVGTQVTITGVSLTQTEGIGFGDHMPAQFTVNSDKQVTAIVPSGAKTGRVGIETIGGTAISAGAFTVTP